MLDTLGAAIYTVDAAGRVTGFSTAAVALWGTAPEIGVTLWCGSWRLYRPDGTPLRHDASPMAIAIAERRLIRGMEVLVERPDGSRLPVLTSPTPLFDAAGELIGGVDMLVDVSAQKRVEIALVQRMAEQATLCDLTDRLHQAKTLDVVYSAAMAATRDALQCDRAAILLLDKSGPMRFAAWSGLSSTYREAVEGHSPWHPDDPDPRPILIGDVVQSDLDGAIAAIVRDERIAALAFVPLVNDGKLVGKLMAYRDSPRDFTPHDVELAMTIGHQLGFAIDRIRGEEERSRIEQELRRSDSRFRALVSLSSDWYWEQDIDLRFTEFATSTVDPPVPGIGSSIGKTRWELPTIGVSDEQWSAHRACLGRHEPFRDFEYRQLGARGEMLWLSINGDPIFDADGHFAGYRGTGRNITFRRRAEEALRTSEARYKTALKVGRMGSWETDFVEMSRTWSPEAVELFGLTLPLGKGFVGAAGDELRAAIHPEDRHLLDQCHALIETQDEIDAEYRIIRPDGSVRYVAGRGQVTARRPDGRAWILVNIVADVTDRALAEQRSLERAHELEAAKAKYQALVEASAQIEWSAAPDGRIINDSPTWRAFSGQTVEEWRGDGWLDAVHPADREHTAAAWRIAIATNGTYDVDYRLRHVSGDYRWTRARGVPLRDPAGSVVEWVGVNEDISDLKQREEHLEVVMRELSHRTKNLLAVIQSIARRTLSAKADNPEVRAFTERLHGLALSHDLLVRGNWHGASLHDLVSTHLEPFGPLNPHSVVIDGPSISLTPSVAQSVGLAIHELATNAAKYGALSGVGGTLEVVWSVLEIDDTRHFSLTWSETSNMSVANANDVNTAGFGRVLLQRIAASLVGGSSDYRIDASGVVWRLVAPLAAAGISSLEAQQPLATSGSGGSSST